MPSLDIDQVLDQALGSLPAQDGAWRQLGFLRNPFPSRAHPIWDVFYDQQDMRDRFYADLVTFLRDSPTTTLLFTGGNRVGKTHFMEYHRRALPRRFSERGLVLPISIASAQSCDFWQLYLQVLEQLDDSLRLQSGAGLFEREVPAALASQFPEALPPGDFRRALERIADAQGATSEHRRLLLRQWLRGERLRAPQREELGVSDLISSLAQVVNVFESLVKYLLLLREPQVEGAGSQAPVPSPPRCPGLLVFLDEFELIWRYRRDRRDHFLQAIRALVDACPKGLFLCVGMATGVGVAPSEVESSYPALFQRLKGARPIPTLVQIHRVTDAIGYTRAFEQHGRSEFLQREGPNAAEGLPEQLFNDREIEDLFREMARGSASVAQGDFFDRIHIEAEQRLRREAGQAQP